MKKVTLVLGASLNLNRYSNMAIQRLRANDIPVFAIGLKEGKVSDVQIIKGGKPLESVHTVTLYLNPKRQEEYYNYIINLQPKRVIFNPGTENTEFEKMLMENNIEVEIACTLVLLSTHQY